MDILLYFIIISTIWTALLFYPCFTKIQLWKTVLAACCSFCPLLLTGTFLWQKNGIPRLLGNFRYFGCRLLHFDPVIVPDRFRLEHRRYRPIFQKTNRIQRIAAGIGTTGCLDRVCRLSPVRLRSDNPWCGLLNILFFAPIGLIFFE